MKIYLSLNQTSISELKLIRKIEDYYNQNIKQPSEYDSKKPLIIDCYISGGAAVSFYSNERATKDLDIEMGKRILLPQIKLDEEELHQNKLKSVYVDLNYNSQLSLMHEDYKENAIEITAYQSNKKNWLHLKPYLFSPEDLIISKLSRFSENDFSDIKKIIDSGIVNSDILHGKVEHAILGYIGSSQFLEHNINDVFHYLNEYELNNENEVEAEVKVDLQHHVKYEVVDFSKEELLSFEVIKNKIINFLFHSDKRKLKK